MQNEDVSQSKPVTPTKLFETRWMSIYRIGHWDYVRRPNAEAAVGILAITDEQKVLLVEQFRTPMQQRVLEIPAGLVGDEKKFKNESLAAAATRELLEETGYHTDKIELLLKSPTSAGMTSEITYIFLARKLTKINEGGGVDGECITVHEVPLSEIRNFMQNCEKSGILVDFKIQAALWQASELLVPNG